MIRRASALWKSLLFVLSFSLLAQTAGLALAEEITIFNQAGDATAYLDTDDTAFTIYLWGGEPVAYIEEGRGDTLSIYSFPGQHLAWLEDGIIWDHAGDAVGFLEGSLGGVTTRIEPIKGIKKIKPIKGVRELEPIKPIFSYSWSHTTLLATFAGVGAPSRGSPSSGSRRSSEGAYTGFGLRHWIRSVEGGGGIVVLEDGSRWEVNPIDRIDTMLWLPITDIEVVQASPPIGSYTYMLINIDDDEAVHVKYLGR